MQTIKFNYRGVFVSHDASLPPFKELARRTAYPNQVEALLWHDAMAEMVAFHASITAMGSVESLTSYLMINGYKGVPDNCMECPFAVAYLAQWKRILADRQLDPERTWVDVTGDRISLGCSRSRIRFRLTPSQIQREFIHAFDHEEIPKLNLTLETSDE